MTVMYTPFTITNLVSALFNLTEKNELCQTSRYESSNNFTPIISFILSFLKKKKFQSFHFVGLIGLLFAQLYIKLDGIIGLFL